MSFDWNEYLRLAQHLSGLANNAASRSAVSRAYYSAFHAASLSVESNKITTNPRYSRDRHLQIWNIYMDSANKECRRIGNSGQRLKWERQEADYDPDSGFPETRVQHAIAQAQALVAGLVRNVPESFSPGRSKMEKLYIYVRRFF
jgi:uncharacterized protein (UPF0332 family)